MTVIVETDRLIISTLRNYPSFSHNFCVSIPLRRAPAGHGLLQHGAGLGGGAKSVSAHHPRSEQGVHEPGERIECFRKHDFAPLLLSPALKITIPARCSIHVVRKPCEKVFAKTL